MNRRAFLTGLAAAFALDPERLLWVKGQKTISVPKPVVREADIVAIVQARMDLAYAEMARIVDRDIQAWLRQPLIGGAYQRDTPSVMWDDSKYPTYGSNPRYWVKSELEGVR